MRENQNYIFTPSGGTKDNSIASLLETMSIIIFIGGFISGIIFGKNATSVSYILSGQKTASNGRMLLRCGSSRFWPVLFYLASVKSSAYCSFTNHKNIRLKFTSIILPLKIFLLALIRTQFTPKQIILTICFLQQM